MDLSEIRVLHHQEQMGAHRRDFQAWWRPICDRMREEGLPFKVRARLEIEAWQEYIRENVLGPRI